MSHSTQSDKNVNQQLNIIRSRGKKQNKTKNRSVNCAIDKILLINVYVYTKLYTRDNWCIHK